MESQRLHRILALDMSTSTGWAVIDEGEELVDYGTIVQKVWGETAPYNTEKEGYPFNYLDAAKRMMLNIFDVYYKFAPDVIVIEETNKGKNRFAQKMLEFIHCLVIDICRDEEVRVVYLDTSKWRQTMSLYMSKEDKKKNADLRKAKKAGKKARGKITKKHLSVRMVNKLYNLNMKMKDNDVCDAILVGLAYFRSQKCKMNNL